MKSIGVFAFLIASCIAMPAISLWSRDTSRNDFLTSTTSPINDKLSSRNISTLYRGNWTLVRNESSESFHKFMKFHKNNGAFAIQLVSSETFHSEIDSVEGDMVFRDGPFSTDENKRFSIQGLHFWKYSKLFLIANPASFPVLDGLEMDVGLNLTKTSVDQMIATFQRELGKSVPIEAGLPTLAPLHITLSPVCYFAFVLDVAPRRHRSGDLEMIGKANSGNCGIDLDLRLHTLEFDVYYSKAMNYVFMIAIASVVEIVLLIRQMEHTKTQAGAAKVSMITIGQQAIIDSYLCLIHLTAAIVVETLFNSFASAAFFKFIAFSIWQMKYLMTIWKSRRPSGSFGDWQSIRHELAQLYARFYSFLMIGFVVLYYFQWFELFLFVLYSFWVPQIYCNASRDSSKAFLPEYLIGTSICRLLLPLYFLACPVNFLAAQPRYGTAVALVCWMILQIIILFTQDFLGPRFFIPKRFLPPKYDYKRPLSLAPEESSDCVICMSPVDLRQRDYMVTPCDHIFHELCLLQWLEQQQNCPTCRRQLPNI